MSKRSEQIERLIEEVRKMREAIERDKPFLPSPWYVPIPYYPRPQQPWQPYYPYPQYPQTTWTTTDQPNTYAAGTVTNCL